MMAAQHPSRAPVNAPEWRRAAEGKGAGWLQGGKVKAHSSAAYPTKVAMVQTAAAASARLVHSAFTSTPLMLSVLPSFLGRRRSKVGRLAISAAAAPPRKS